MEDDIFVSLRDVNEIIDNQLQKIKDSGKKRLTPAELNLQIVKKEIDRIINRIGIDKSKVEDRTQYHYNCGADMRGET